MLENLAGINLFRHGQAGPRDAYDALFERGVEGAQALGTFLVRSEIDFDILVVGPLVRQRMTAELVRQAYARADRSIPTLTADDTRFGHEFEQMRLAIESGDAEVHRGHNYCDAAVIRDAN
jgi:phosphohistidine phosphatase SixA